MSNPIERVGNFIKTGREPREQRQIQEVSKDIFGRAISLLSIHGGVKAIDGINHTVLEYDAPAKDKKFSAGRVSILANESKEDLGKAKTVSIFIGGFGILAVTQTGDEENKLYQSNHFDLQDEMIGASLGVLKKCENVLRGLNPRIEAANLALVRRSNHLRDDAFRLAQARGRLKE